MDDEVTKNTNSNFILYDQGLKVLVRILFSPPWGDSIMVEHQYSIMCFVDNRV